MSKEINLEGIEIHRELIRVLSNFKQGKVLENNYHTVNVMYSRDMMLDFDRFGMSPKNIEDKIKHDMISKLSVDLYPKLSPQIKRSEDDLGNSIKFSLEFMMIQPHELKHIVDYCVRTMPLDAINEIRKP